MAPVFLTSYVIPQPRHCIGLTSVTNRTRRIDGVWLWIKVYTVLQLLSCFLDHTLWGKPTATLLTCNKAQAAMWQVHVAKNWGLLLTTSTRPGCWAHHLSHRSSSPSHAFRWLHLYCNLLRNPQRISENLKKINLVSLILPPLGAGFIPMFLCWRKEAKDQLECLVEKMAVRHERSQKGFTGSHVATVWGTECVSSPSKGCNIHSLEGGIVSPSASLGIK